MKRFKNYTVGFKQAMSVARKCQQGKPQCVPEQQERALKLAKGKRTLQQAWNELPKTSGQHQKQCQPQHWGQTHQSECKQKPSSTDRLRTIAQKHARPTPRPALPSFLYGAAGLWLGCIAGNYLQGVLQLSIVVVLCMVGVVLAAGLLAVAVRVYQQAVVVALVALLFMLGVALSCTNTYVLEQQREVGLSLSGETFRFRVLDDVTEGMYGSYIEATAYPYSEGEGTLTRFAHSLFGTNFKVRIYLSDESFAYGSEFVARATFSEPSDIGRATYNKKGIALRCSLFDEADLTPSGFGNIAQIRSAFVQRLEYFAQTYGFSEEATALLSAVVVGNRTELFTTTLYQEVKALGLAHLVAVSGAHLVIVLGLVRSMLNALRASKRMAIGIQVVFLALYLVVVGFPISCIRAAGMSAVSLFSYSVKRRSHALSALSVVVILFIVLDPSAAYSLSFALSVLATLGILLFMPLFTSWASNAGPRLRSWVIDPACMTLAALVLTFPVTCVSFAQVPLLAPLSNVIATPFLTLICGIGMLAFVLSAVPVVSVALLAVLYAAATAFCTVMNVLVSLPIVSIPVSVSVVAVVVLCIALVVWLWAAWPVRAPVRALMVMAGCGCAVALIVGAFSGTTNEVIMLDVGQGDAFVVRSNGVTLLVDTGNQTTSLYEALARHNITSLDAVLITHADDDHCGSLSALYGVVPVSKVFIADGMDEVEDASAISLVQTAQTLVGKQNVYELQTGSVVTVGTFTLEVISPDELTDSGGNADSICFILESDINNDGVVEFDGLFCGDAEADVLQGLVDDGLLAQVDVYKVGHHGALAALDEELAEELSPKIALISVGATNTYGHPREEVLAMLEAVGTQIFRTDEQGDVTCVFKQDTIEVTTMQ